MIDEEDLRYLLMEERISEFNYLRPKDVRYNIVDCDLSRKILKSIDGDNVNFSNVNFEHSDLRGSNFENSLLNGCCLFRANISGCIFPNDISTEEIILSVEKGTLLRHR